MYFAIQSARPQPALIHDLPAGPVGWMRLLNGTLSGEQFTVGVLRLGPGVAEPLVERV